MKNIIVAIVLIVIVAVFVPWKNVTWGKIVMQPAETVTVNGSATNQVASQIASFTAGVMATDLDKNKAINEVNSKINDVVLQVKNFGVDSADIKTQNLSYYQEQKGSLNPGQWSVNNTVEITLRDITKAQALADLLSKTGANNVYGPNFRLNENDKSANQLFEAAINDAKVKADNMAKASGRKLGKVLNVSEGVGGGTVQPFFGKAAGMGGAAIEPGSQSVSQSVTVTFELL